MGREGGGGGRGEGAGRRKEKSGDSWRLGKAARNGRQDCLGSRFGPAWAWAIAFLPSLPGGGACCRHRRGADAVHRPARSGGGGRGCRFRGARGRPGVLAADFEEAHGRAAPQRRERARAGSIAPRFFPGTRWTLWGGWPGRANFDVLFPFIRFQAELDTAPRGVRGESANFAASRFQFPAESQLS